MDYQGYEEFESELGHVAITDSHIEREERESEEWEHIKQEFSSDELLDKIHFSRIEDLGYRPDSLFPHILVKVDGEWRRMFFRDTDNEVYDCFKYLRYQWKAYRQNH